ncbi:hypothetical protein PR048_029842, partial [Dryococelus australis]
MEQKRTTRLIELFKEKCVLWDPSDLHFNDMSIKHDACAELEVDMSEVEEKVRSLIGQFQCELKKGKSCSAADASYKSKWVFLKSRLFLRDKYEPLHKREAGFQEASFNQDSVQSDDNNNTTVMNDTQSLHESDVDERNQVYKPSPEEKDNVLAEEAYMVMKELSSRVQKRDEFDVFGDCVAHPLRNLTRKSNQNNAKFQINNVLYQFEMNDQLPTCSSPCLHTSSAVCTPGPRGATPVPSTHTAGRDIVYVADLGLQDVLLN